MLPALLAHALAFGPLVLAQNLVQEAPPPPPILLTTPKSGVLPSLPTATPFAGIDTLQGAIIAPLPPQPGYTGLLGTATAQSNLPASTYRATLPASLFNPLVGSAVRGTIEGVGSATGVRFTLNLTNLPSQAQYGPFNWHIHTLPVPGDGNCTATLSHLDPTNRGEYIMCDAAQPQTCQVGDLAGKHGGKIVTPGNFSTSFVDPYLSTQPGSAGFFGGLGFVLHTGNTSRITCANFLLVGGNGTANVSASAGPSPTGSVVPVFTGAAGRVGGGSGGVVVGMVAALLVL